MEECLRKEKNVHVSRWTWPQWWQKCSRLVIETRMMCWPGSWPNAHTLHKLSGRAYGQCLPKSNSQGGVCGWDARAPGHLKDSQNQENWCDSRYHVMCAKNEIYTTVKRRNGFFLLNIAQNWISWVNHTHTKWSIQCYNAQIRCT